MKSCEENIFCGINSEVIEALQAKIGKENVVACNLANAKVCTVPKSVDDVFNIVKIANKYNVTVASTNNPSLAICGSINPTILVDLSKMDKILEFDPVGMFIKVEAGCTWKSLIDTCEKEGYIIGAHPVDISAMVGQWASMNNVGIGTYKYGTSKDNVMNLKLVTTDAKILETGYDRLGHYMSGYNFTEMYAASEGTLGIISIVTFKLFPKGVVKSFAYTFDNTDTIYSAIQKIVSHPSIKPFDMVASKKDKTLIITLQGEDSFVEFESQEIESILTELGATKNDECSCNEIWNNRCTPGKFSKAIIPLKAWKSFLSKCDEGVCCSVVDPSSLCVMSLENEKAFEERAIECGGRSLMYPHFGWNPTKALDNESKAKLSRDVSPSVISKLEDIVGKNNVTTHGVDKLLYCHDLAPLPKESGIAFNNMPDVIVRPSKVEEISQIVSLANSKGIAIVPRGNASWGLGGCMPTSGGIVVDMASKMNKILEMDTETMTVKVHAGCTWKFVLDECMKKGFIVGSYPSSFPSATIGAWIATNGMGTGNYKYGSAKDNILNMQVVISDGTIIETGEDGLASFMKSYNLNQFFAGSEGTLCVFGTVTFRIYPMGIIKPLAYDFPVMKDINEPIQKLIQHPSIKPLHVAFSDELHFINQKKAGLPVPDVKNLLLLTLQGDEKFVEFEENELDKLVSSCGGVKVNDKIAAHEWDERCYEFRARSVGVGEIPAEVIVPATEWGVFTDECYNAFKVMRSEAGGIIGVIVDRNTALFMPYYFKDDESLLGMTAFGFNFYLGDIATKYGGRTTGFGVFFAWNLENIHDIYTAKYMREIKSNLDPNDVVNPGHLVCGMTRFGIDMNKQLMGLGSSVMQIAKKVLPTNTTFKDNIIRFRYDTLEQRKEADRMHKLGDGTE